MRPECVCPQHGTFPSSRAFPGNFLDCQFLHMFHDSPAPLVAQISPLQIALFINTLFHCPGHLLSLPNLSF